MNFIKYQHVEKLMPNDENIEVKGLLNGKVYVQIKLDGTNTTCWLDDNGNVAVGKRSCMMGEGVDNAGSKKYILGNPSYKALLECHPTWRLCGEFMVRHTIKTYKDDVWGKFYIFDVIDEKNGDTRNYLRPEEYIPELERFGLPYIPTYKVLENPTYDDLVALLEEDYVYFVTNGSEEGLTFKNFDYLNPYGRRTWGKLVRETFKNMSYGKGGYDKSHSLEEKIVSDLLSKEYCEKEMAKILESHDGVFRSEYISEIIGRTQAEFIKDNILVIIRKYNKPTINFRELNSEIISAIKRNLNLF